MGLLFKVFVFALLITQTLKKTLKGHLQMLHNILINLENQSLERCFSMIALPEDPGSVSSSHSKWLITADLGDPIFGPHGKLHLYMAITTQRHTYLYM